jgi:hypothetical protein
MGRLEKKQRKRNERMSSTTATQNGGDRDVDEMLGHRGESQRLGRKPESGGSRETREAATRDSILQTKVATHAGRDENTATDPQARGNDEEPPTTDPQTGEYESPAPPRQWQGAGVTDEDTILRLAYGTVLKMYNYMDEHIDDRPPGCPMGRACLARTLWAVVRRLRCSLLALPAPAAKNARKKAAARRALIGELLDNVESTFCAIYEVDGLFYNGWRLQDLMSHGEKIRAIAGDDEYDEAVILTESESDEGAFVPDDEKWLDEADLDDGEVAAD